MQTLTKLLLSGLLFLSVAPDLKAQVEKSEKVTYRIDFLGAQPANDWSIVASVLVDTGFAPIGTLTITKPVAGLCDSVMEPLNFHAVGLGCSEPITALLKRMNPHVADFPALGSTITYPNLPLETFKWTLFFDTSSDVDKSRRLSVARGWRQFQIDEKSRGPQVNTVLEGFRTRFTIPSTESAVKAVQSLQDYNKTLQRNDIRVIRIDDNPIAKSPQSNPAQWYRDCLSPAGAAPPKPSYATILGLAKMPNCVTACVQRGTCPEIILLDKEVRPHKDVARAIGKTAANTAPDLCPHTDWDIEFHGTHLAGIMVSDANGTGFPGLAPGAVLVPKAYERLTAEQLEEFLLEKERFSTKKGIVVFASQFNVENSDLPLDDPILRRETPFIVQNIVNGSRLWIVAAGNGRTGKNISDVSRLSPMNLGDHPNILVVTACENCLDDAASLSGWANYSKHHLVNIAAPGGTPDKQIPAPATETHYSASYGTSQAAAFVGGLAAAMLSCYPDEYALSSRLKQRIQGTARPPFQTESAEKLAAGFVNAEMALRDPTVHWLSLANGEDPKEVAELLWCQQFAPLRKRSGHVDLVTATQIRQIARHVDSTWTFIQEYEPNRAEKRSGNIWRIGPGRLVEDVPLLRVRYRNGTESAPLKLSEIENLLVGFAPSSVVPNRCRE